LEAKSIFSVYLPVALATRARALSARNKDLFAQTTIVSQVDKRGLTAEDYAKLQQLARTTMTGDALLNYIFINKIAAGQQFTRAAIRRNNASVLRAQMRDRSGVSFSRIVEVLLTKAVESLEENAPVERATSAKSDAGKTSTKRTVKKARRAHTPASYDRAASAAAENQPALGGV
jgi:hypothetical protein